MIGAACASSPVSFEMPPGDPRAPGHKAQVAAAKAVCEACPVIDECRRSAVGPRGGDLFPGMIVAGLTPTERRPRARTPHARRSARSGLHPLVASVLEATDPAAGR